MEEVVRNKGHIVYSSRYSKDYWMIINLIKTAEHTLNDAEFELFRHDRYDSRLKTFTKIKMELLELIEVFRKEEDNA